MLWKAILDYIEVLGPYRTVIMTILCGAVVWLFVAIYQVFRDGPQKKNNL